MKRLDRFLTGILSFGSACFLRQVATIAGLFFCGLIASLPAAGAEESPLSSRFFSMPMELEFDSGADNGDAAFLKFVPIYSVPLNENWRLVNMNLISLIDAPGGVPGSPGNPSPSPGDKTFGLGDLTHFSLFTPRTKGDSIYGMGFMLTVPTATDSVLGSEKWSAGPALRMVYRAGPWNLGVVAGNQWSFEGANDRGDVNQLMMRGSLRRNLANNWYLVSGPVVTANWKAQKSSDTWMLPLGGGIGKVFNLQSRPWAVSLQAYANVIKPDGAPDWMVRFALVAQVPRAVFGL